MRSGFILMIMTLPFLANGQNLWKAYKPTQSDIVGWKVSYVKSTNEIRKSENRSDSIVTSDAGLEYDRYETKNSIDIIGLNKTLAKITTIQPMGKVYLDLAYRLKPPAVAGEIYVHSGLRADSCKITFKRNVSLQITPQEILDAIRAMYRIDSPWIKIRWVDSLTFNKTDSSYIIIKNPNIYYAVSVVELRKVGPPLKPKTFFPNETRTFNPTKGKLLEQIGVDKMKQLPKVLNPDFDSLNSASATTIGLDPNHTVTLFTIKNNFGQPQLYAHTSFDNYRDILIRPNIGSKWELYNLSLGLYNHKNLQYVDLKISIKAVRSGSSIKIIESYLHFPRYNLVDK